MEIEGDEKEDESIVEEVVENGRQEVYYKFNSPMFPLEIDWTITLSQNDFPWNEIKFNGFSSKDCFEKY